MTVAASSNSGAEEAGAFNGAGAIPASPIVVTDKYNEIFEIEIDCWCYGFAKFPGELTAPLVHRVIKELAGVFRAAIDHNYIFDIHQTAHLIFEAVGGIIDVKEITFAILAQFPQPAELSEDGQFIMAQIIDQAEHQYGGVLERLEKKWRSTRPERKQAVGSDTKRPSVPNERKTSSKGPRTTMVTTQPQALGGVR